jgi:sulfate adenylyltransferase subunit 2
MNDLDELEAESIYVFREAYPKLKNIAILWSIGKNSNVVLWLARKTFFGHIPFPVLFIDTENEFRQFYEFRDQRINDWRLNYVQEQCPPVEEVDPTLPPAARKTYGLKNAIAKHGYNDLIAGIRRDDEAIRAKERYFSPRDDTGAWDLRDQPPEFFNQYMTSFPPDVHVRVHPILHWSEVEIWKYTKRENIPLVELYFTKDGKRYRSLGEEEITHPIASEATTIDDIIAELESTRVPERSGRAMDHESEDSFERLRAAGYM